MLRWVTFFTFLFICSNILFYVDADVGPKRSLAIYAKNMPEGLCYLDLLVENYPGENLRSNVHMKTDQRLMDLLKSHHESGWHLAMIEGTSVPLFGDIECDVKKGKCRIDLSYFGVPDRFKIIVADESGNIKVSNIVKRNAFKSTVYFDYISGKAVEMPFILSLLLDFLITCPLTLIIEGLILLLFGFSLKPNWKLFITVNISTQIFLVITVFTCQFYIGFWSLFVFFLCEFFILIIETSIFVLFLKEHAKIRRALFSITANLVSFVLGIAILIIPFFRN